ncbi:MAG: EAL domain-containing protein, partial [Candidatus Eremiobacteraeota bacterium]|nr:EAL domain-containing protein [Candidatus Eremiobacteraeota bacterium]
LIADLVPELADLATRRFTSLAKTVAGERRVDVRVENLSGGLDEAGAALVELRALQLVPVPETRPELKRSERLESLWTLVVRRGLAGGEQVRAILREAMRGIELEHVTLSRVERGELVTDFADDEQLAGERISIESSLERRAVAGSGTFAVLDTALDCEFAGVADRTRSFLSSAFRVGDQRWVLTLSSALPRARSFGREDWEYVDHVVEAVARAIERRENDARIERLAYYDVLTTLPNRIALHGRLDDALEEAERTAMRAAVLFLDIDGFKNVNDTVGHRGGDIVLAEIAQRLRGTLRRDEYIGRLGGDEFAIVMPCIADRNEIESIAGRIASVLTFPFAVDGYRFPLSASIGAAVYPDDATGRDDLLACADAAMYLAKYDGGARVRFRESPNSSDDTAAFASTELASEARELGYLLCYQPIVDLRTGSVTAAEALIRRIHPSHGLLAPESGWSISHDVIGRRALDRWVLREATAQARLWNEAGMPVRVDVNLAAHHVDDLEALLEDERFAADAWRLRVEITASHFEGEAAERMERFVDRCAETGIGLALDGFDGGLAALPALSHLPIDALKLEKPLVESISASRTTRAIVEGSIVVARSLGWKVIAKGVETALQHDALISLGCDAMQGFYGAHPMTAADFGTWLRERGSSAERQA